MATTCCRSTCLLCVPVPRSIEFAYCWRAVFCWSAEVGLLAYEMFHEMPKQVRRAAERLKPFPIAELVRPVQICCAAFHAWEMFHETP